MDAQLLAATRLTADAELWTNDKRLAAAASRLGCAIDPTLTDAGHEAAEEATGDD